MSMIIFINVHPRNNKTAFLCTMLPFRKIQEVKEKSIFLDVSHFMVDLIFLRPFWTPLFGYFNMVSAITLRRNFPSTEKQHILPFETILLKFIY